MASSQGNQSFDWDTYLSEIMDAADNADMNEVEQLSSDEIIRRLAGLPLDRVAPDVEGSYFPNFFTLLGHEPLETSSTPDLQEPLLQTPIMNGTETPSQQGGAETRTTPSSTPQTNGVSSTPLSQEHCDALFDYESALSRLYGTTTGATETNGDSTTLELRPMGMNGNVVVSGSLPERPIPDTPTRWLLVCDLMASFSRLHPSQVSQSTGLHGNRSIFHHVIWQLWLVVERQDREALRRVDRALRGEHGDNF